MECSAPLPLPLCSSYKIATNKYVQAQRPALHPFSWDALISTKVSKLLRGHCAESLIPTQVVEVLQMLAFKPLIFLVTHFQAAAPCPGFQGPLVRGRVFVRVCARNRRMSRGNPALHMLAPTVFFKSVCIPG